MKIDFGWAMIGLAGAGVIAIGLLTVIDRMQPPRLEWVAVDVSPQVQVMGRIEVRAETERRSDEGCTNGVQADVRGGKSVTRLPAPEREVSDGRSIYRIDLPETLYPGVYDVRLRETFNCGGPPQAIESPWMAFEVVP